MPLMLESENTHRWGKYHCTAGLQFYKVLLLLYIQIATYFLFWSVPVLLNWRPAVQWSFSQRWVFSVRIDCSDNLVTVPLVLKSLWGKRFGASDVSSEMKTKRMGGNKSEIWRGLFAVWPDWAIYWTLSDFIKPLAIINFAQISHILRQF